MKNTLFKKIACLCLCMLLLSAVTLSVYAEGAGITPRYSFTAAIKASLNLSGGTAYCSGSVTPSGGYNSSITVTLYRQENGSWVYVTSWYGSASGSATASAGGSKYVGTGTFKVVSNGIIGNGLERPTTYIVRSN
ncbi:MAG: hypothetical protein E7331_08815 [Clostridiales bacterium]|nr:hypothetical protein [Clostridiales bacterium]